MPHRPYIRKAVGMTRPKHMQSPTASLGSVRSRWELIAGGDPVGARCAVQGRLPPRTARLSWQHRARGSLPRQVRPLARLHARHIPPAPLHPTDARAPLNTRMQRPARSQATPADDGTSAWRADLVSAAMAVRRRHDCPGMLRAPAAARRRGRTDPVGQGQDLTAERRPGRACGAVSRRPAVVRQGRVRSAHAQSVQNPKIHTRRRPLPALHRIRSETTCWLL